ncbi:MAG: OsmC family protein [Pseudonocardia sediminis]
MSTPHPPSGDTTARPEPGTVVVSASDARPYGQDVDTDLLHWNADEPESAGGAGSGPDPYQLLLSALGTCTAITLRMYADRAGLPLDDVTVTLTHDRLHAKDCEECETSTGHVDRIVREVRLVGDLDEAQRAKLIAIADRCPVHRTLTSEMVIETDEV